MLEILEAEYAVRSRADSASATFRVLREAGVFDADAPTLQEIRSLGQRSVDQLVDRYPIACRPMRDLLVERKQLTYLGFLSELVIAECDDCTLRRSERRVRDAGFPRPKRLEEFSFEANPTLDPAVIGQLSSCDWVKAGHPLCLIGDSGTGKSHLLIALGHAGRRSGIPGPLYPGHQVGQRTRRSR